MRYLKVKIFLFHALFFFSLGGIVFADKIKLKDGRIIDAPLIEITDKDVVLKAGPGKMWFSREKVESINDLSIEEMQTTISTAKSFVVGDEEGKIASTAAEGLNYVSKIRGLEFKNKPAIELVTKERLKENVKKEIEKYSSEEDLERRAKLLLKMGLVSRVEEYKEKALELFSEQIAGYYNPDDKKIYVTKDTMLRSMPGVPSIDIMHEQVHALQDQYFDLKKITSSMLSAGNEDKSFAIQSVIEGEATVLMFDAYLRSLKSWGAPFSQEKGFDIRSFVLDTMLAASKHYKDASGKPAIFMEDLLFPYVWGGVFIQHTVNTKGWKEVDSLYKDFPSSTEQIMHPEKYYISREEPKEVVLPALDAVLSAPWVKLSEDTLGEFSFYLIGKNFLDELSSKVMSEGWGGDRFALYEEPVSRQLLFISLSKWDSENEAQGFYDLYRKILEKKYQQLALVKEEQNSARYKSEQEGIYIAKAKDVVLLIEGAADQTMEAIIKIVKP